MGRGRYLVLLSMLAALAGCGMGADDPGPGGVTAGEARALDEAAEMLEKRRLPDEALQPGIPSATPVAPG